MSYFDKFINDLAKREKKEKETTKVSQQEHAHQEKRRLRVRRFQERWQNSIKYNQGPGKKK